MDEKDSSSRGDSKAPDDKDGSPPKAAAKPSRGRRERRAFESTDEKSGGGDKESSQTDKQRDGSGGDAPKPRRRRQADDNSGGGWMTTGGGATASVTHRQEDEEPRETAPNANNKDKHFQDDNDEIILIPDLDEDGADADQRIAHAPKNVHRKIPTLSELEDEVKTAVASSDEGLRLNVLLSTLVPAAMVQEEDQPWTFDSLLREITDELSDTPKTVVHTYIPGTTKQQDSSKQTTNTNATAGTNASAGSGNAPGKGDGFGFTPVDGEAKAQGGRGQMHDRK